MTPEEKITQYIETYVRNRGSKQAVGPDYAANTLIESHQSQGKEVKRLVEVVRSVSRYFKDLRTLSGWRIYLIKKLSRNMIDINRKPDFL